MEEKKAYKHLVYAMRALTRKNETLPRAGIENRVIKSLVTDIMELSQVLGELYPGIDGEQVEDDKEDSCGE